MIVALVVGGATCVWDDHQAALLLFTPDIIVVTNDIGTVYPHEIDAWASYHVDLLINWSQKRLSNGLPPAKELWTTSHIQPHPRWEHVKRHNQKGGSSGLLSTQVALTKADKVVLAGVPMNPTMAHWRDKGGRGKVWKEAEKYHKTWLKHIQSDFGDRVRSMSGWTADKLGHPTEEWLHG